MWREGIDGIGFRELRSADFDDVGAGHLAVEALAPVVPEG